MTEDNQKQEEWELCPFCGSHNLREDNVMLCTDEGEEDILVIECLDCDAQARADRWNDRV